MKEISGIILLVFLLYMGYIQKAKSDSMSHLQNEELTCLAKNVYFEARGEPIEGQEYVAHVTLNRVLSDKFPNTICEVVWQKRQFSWTHDGLSDVPKNLEKYQTALKISLDTIISRFYDGVHNKEILYFHAKYVRPHWSKAFTVVKTIGNHIFYEEG